MVICQWSFLGCTGGRSPPHLAVEDEPVIDSVFSLVVNNCPKGRRVPCAVRMEERLDNRLT